MVWGLAWRCCIRRRVKKLSRRAAKLIAAFMADPPSAARVAASPRALVPDSLPNTTACLRRGRGRGKRTGRAIEPRDPHRLDTIARARLSQSDGANAEFGICARMPSPGKCRVIAAWALILAG